MLSLRSAPSQVRFVPKSWPLLFSAGLSCRTSATLTPSVGAENKSWRSNSVASNKVISLKDFLFESAALPPVNFTLLAINVLPSVVFPSEVSLFPSVRAAREPSPQHLHGFRLSTSHWASSFFVKCCFQ